MTVIGSPRPAFPGTAASDRCAATHRHLRRARITAVVALLACSGGGGNASSSGSPTAPVDNAIARIDISPSASQSVVSGSTVTLTAAAFTRDGRSVSAAGVTWNTTDQAVASVSGGVVTGRLAGSATITATSGTATSPGVTVTVTPGAAVQLGVKTAPAGARAGVAFTTQPVVEVRDAAGNLVSTATAQITVAIGSGGGTLSGTATVAAAGGVATFTNLSIAGLVGARTLTFSATGLTVATTAAFTLDAGAAAVLAIRTQPVAGTAYAAFPTPAVVELRDGYGNLTSATLAVTATIASGGGTLGGAATVNAVAGIATFTTLQVNGVAGQRTLTFASGSLAPVTSAAFQVNSAPPAIIAAPATTITAGLGTSPQPVTVTVTNTGVFPLTNLRVTGTTYTPSASAGWLATSFTAGTDAPATLRLTASSAALAVGTYTATVTLAGDGAATTGTLTVTLTVTPPAVNTYGTTANKVSVVAIGGTVSPGMVSLVNGAPGTDPTLAYVSRAPGVASVDATGRITGVGSGQGWVVATSTRAGYDSVHVIVPPASGVVLRTDLTKYTWNIGDTITVRVLMDTRGASVGAVTANVAWSAYVGAGVQNPLTYIDITAGQSTMAPQWTVNTIINVIRINGNAAAGTSGVVELAVIRYRVAKSGNVTLAVSPVDVVAADFSSLLATSVATQYPVIIP
jgi:hypothetical protein